MTLFELVKQTIRVRDAAEHYGLQVNRSGMCRCPFHDDRHPSMKLNEKYFYCFGCGATGDVIDLVARLFGLSSFKAAQKLAQNFGIDPDKPPAAIALPKPKRPLLTAYRQEEMRCLRVLCDYHLHVVYVPVVEKQILWSKRCKDKSLVGTVKETIMQVSRSKKWESKVALDEQGHPLLTAKGKKVLRASYSVLQDDFFNYMKAAGYTDVERGERGSTEEHLTVTQFKVAQEKQRLETMTAQIAQTEQTLNNTQAVIEKKEKELQSLQKQAKEQHAAALTVQEIRSMGKKTITGNVSFTPSECNILKDYAVTGLLVKAENSRLEEKLRSAQWSAAIWKQRYDALYNAYQELKKEVQPYLDAVKLAPEKVRAFFDELLTRTRQARQPTKPIRRKQDMER